MSAVPAASHQPAFGWLPGAVVWRCAGCPKVLGLVTPTALIVRHEKREIEVVGRDLSYRQVCDDCGTENIWPPPAPEAAP